MPTRHGGILANRASIWPRNPFGAAQLRRADPGRSHGRSSCRTTEIELLGRGVLSLARLQPQHWRGRRTAIPLVDLALGITQARQISRKNVNQITLDTPCRRKNPFAAIPSCPTGISEENMPSHPQYDVAIVGASIAGCAAAIFFGRAGARVALIERDRDPAGYKRLCTHYIQASATPTLERLGLARAIEEAGGVRNDAEVFTRWGWIVAPSEQTIRRPAYGYNIRRSDARPDAAEDSGANSRCRILAGVLSSRIADQTRTNLRRVGARRRRRQTGY